MTKKNMTAVIARSDLMDLISYDKETGVFAWKDRADRPSYFANRSPGTVGANGRVYIGVDGARYLAHRLAWFYVTGRWPNANIVMKNGDYQDLRFDNLKKESQSETSRKSSTRQAPTSGVRGVHWVASKKKWRAEITVNYNNHFLGYFKNKEMAVKAYKAAARNLGDYEGCNDATAIGRRESGRVAANIRRLWRRTLAASGGVTGWENESQFAQEIIAFGEVARGLPLVAIDATKKIGPGNWKVGTNSELGRYFNASDRSARLEYNKAHRKAYRPRYRAKELMRNFGLTIEDYERMLDEQGHVCAICKKPETATRDGKVRGLAVDHCHKTGAIRGLLCNACNSGLGYFNDNTNAINRAADYIERHAAKSKTLPSTNVVHLKTKK